MPPVQAAVQPAVQPAVRVVTDNLFIGHASRMDVRASVDFLSFGERDVVYCRAAASGRRSFLRPHEQRPRQDKQRTSSWCVPKPSAVAMAQLLLG